MVRILTFFLVIALLAVLGYRQFSNPALDERSQISMGVETVKKSKKLSASEEQILAVQLAILDYTAKKGVPPRSLNELVPTYFDSVPVQPGTSEPLAYKRTGTMYQLGEQVDQPVKLAKAKSDNSKETAEIFTEEEKKQGFVNPNEMIMEEFVYDATGKRDPFRPFDLSGKKDSDGPLTPLQRYSLKQLRCTSIVTNFNGGYNAIVEDQSGKGYIVKKGTKIGDSNGEVVSIERDRIKILETKVDLTGKENTRVVEMKLQEKAGAK